MHRLHRILPFVIMGLLATPALARDGAQIKAQFEAGVAAYDAGDYEKAFKLWWDLQYEDVAAMRNTAMMLRKGQGTTKDPRKAQELYERAAEIGLPTAQADLADMLLKGEAGPPDLEHALPLLTAAAAANHPMAQLELGELYETGAPPYLPKDLEISRQLYAASASHVSSEAAARLAALPPPAPADTAKPGAQPPGPKP